MSPSTSSAALLAFAVLSPALLAADDDLVEVELRAVDLDTGRGIPGVAFARENSLAEDWAAPVGTADADGVLRVRMSWRPGYYYSVWKAPAGYDVAGVDDARLRIGSDGAARHTFLLHRRSFPPPPRLAPLTAAELARVPPPRRLAGSVLWSTTVEDMPGFAPRPVEFRFYPVESGVAAEQRALAADIFRQGARVAAAARGEIQQFQRAVPEDRGRLDRMERIVIQIDRLDPSRPRWWSLTCHLPGEIFSRGYRVTFKDLTWWGLGVPDYWQDDYGR